jgi:hypothetical protein
MESPEQYAPTPEETEEAEKKMYESQRRASDNRETILGEWQRIGRNGYLEYEKDEGEPLRGKNSAKIEGVIDGVKISITQTTEGSVTNYSGQLNGKEITSEESGKLFDKYIRLACDKKLEKEAANSPTTEDLFQALMN